MTQSSWKQRFTIATLSTMTILGVGATAPAHAQRTIPTLPVVYVFNDIGGSSIWSFAYGINNNGQAAGDMDYYTGSSSKVSRAFRTAANQPIAPATDDMGTLPGSWKSLAYGINDNGDIVGDAYFLSSSSSQRRAFLKSGSSIYDLHEIVGATNSSARAISKNNWIVGYYTQSNNLNQAFCSFGRGYTFSLASWIGNPAQSEAWGTSSGPNGEQIVGWRTPTIYSQPHAFYLSVAGSGNIWSVDLGTLPGGYWSKAYGVNTQKQVVGEADTWTGNQGRTHAFIWQDTNGNRITDPGEMRDLDTAGNQQSGALAINSSGIAVGYFGNPDIIYGNSRACMFKDGAVIDLNTYLPTNSGWTLRAATGINDAGQIVGWGKDPYGNYRAFRIDVTYRIIIRTLPFP